MVKLEGNMSRKFYDCFMHRVYARDMVLYFNSETMDYQYAPFRSIVNKFEVERESTGKHYIIGKKYKDGISVSVYKLNCEIDYLKERTKVEYFEFPYQNITFNIQTAKLEEVHREPKISDYDKFNHKVGIGDLVLVSLRLESGCYAPYHLLFTLGIVLGPGIVFTKLGVSTSHKIVLSLQKENYTEEEKRLHEELLNLYQRTEDLALGKIQLKKGDIVSLNRENRIGIYLGEVEISKYNTRQRKFTHYSNYLHNILPLTSYGFYELSGNEYAYIPEYAFHYKTEDDMLKDAIVLDKSGKLDWKMYFSYAQDIPYVESFKDSITEGLILGHLDLSDYKTVYMNVKLGKYMKKFQADKYTDKELCKFFKFRFIGE